jgi:TonB-dependent starch-binding outer membrane protein SusC
MIKRPTTNLFIFLFCVACSAMFAQRTIEGKIVDKGTQESMIGASVLVQESGQGAVTDENGVFKLSVSGTDKNLIISYTGYETKTIEIGSESSFLIELNEGELLKEVLVVGYGTIQKSDKTGAIESIKPKTQEVQQYSNFQEFLQGRAAGVQILSNGSELNSTQSIRIRGANSLRGDNEPLYVIDGIIVNSTTEDVADPLQGGNSYLSAQNGLSGINPQDIESIEILKDASATAIYGSRGANGVVIITTKRGNTPNTKFTYNMTTKVGEATRLYDVLTGDGYVDYINEFRKVQNFAPTFYRYGDGSLATFTQDAAFMETRKDSIPRLPQINWYNDILQQSVAQTHRLTASGGNEKNNYYVGLSYNDAKGIVPNTRMKSADLLLKYGHQLTKRITINPRVSAQYIVNNASKGTDGLGSSNTSFARQLTEAVPLQKFSENNTSVDIEDAVDGPRAWIDDYRDDSNELRALASLSADVKISDVFTYRLLGGLDFRNKERKLWYGTTLFRGNIANGEAGIGNLNRVRYNMDHSLMFKKEFSKKHSLNGTVAFVVDETNVAQRGSTATNFFNKDLTYNGIGFGQTYGPLQYFNSDETIVSYLGRANYSFRNKYLATVSFRRDGSSKFTEENRWSLFPSASIAWKMTNEKFIKNLKIFSEAKLRLGYGQTGSQAIQPYQTLTRFTPTGNLLSDGKGGSVTAVIPQNLGNDKLKWETTEQLNLGFDFGLWDDRVTGSIDAYNKTTRDLLQQLAIGPSVGFSNFLTNLGDLSNKGIDLSVSGYVLDGKFKWKLNTTFSLNRNKILNLGVPEAVFGNESRKAILGERISGGTVFKVPANIFIEGQEAGLFWGYKTSGIIQDANALSNAPSIQGIASKLGDVLYVDQNGDKNINESDLTIIGNPNPKYSFGVGSDFSFGNATLSFFVNGVQGNQIANGNLGRFAIPTGLTTNNILSEAYAGAWREGRTDATYPRLGYDIKGDFTDRMVEDGSFMRLSYVSLSYNLGKKIKGLDNASLFVSGHNLLLLTKYSGFDPEVNSFAFDPTRRGIDWSSFPNQKSFSFGLNTQF